MKAETLIIYVLEILFVSNVSPAKVSETPERELSEPAFQESDSSIQSQSDLLFIAQASLPSESNPLSQRSRRLDIMPTATPPGVHPKTTEKNPTVTKIFELKHADTKELARLIENLFRIRVDINYRLNRVIVNATKEQMESIESFIEAMDVAGPEASTFRDTQNLVYRIYMFETSSGDEGMKPFSMILRTTTHVPSQELLDAVVDKDLKIGEFLQSNDFDKPEVEILIQGKAASNESLKSMISQMAPESHIIELKWDDDETFTNNIAVAQYTQLSEQMQKYIRKFLGENIRTVGYWFGNSSVPGDVVAPIGPWTLKLRFDAEPDRMLALNVEVEVPGEIHHFDRRLGHERSNEIFSNTIRAKIGKPIIIGYNRESYGSRKMGAMVIVPEADMIQLQEHKSSF